jgi:hypothetical protein
MTLSKKTGLGMAVGGHLLGLALLATPSFLDQTPAIDYSCGKVEGRRMSGSSEGSGEEGFIYSLSFLGYVVSTLGLVGGGMLVMARRSQEECEETRRRSELYERKFRGYLSGVHAGCLTVKDKPCL